jgi:hypothetical protein
VPCGKHPYRRAAELNLRAILLWHGRLASCMDWLTGLELLHLQTHLTSSFHQHMHATVPKEKCPGIHTPHRMDQILVSMLAWIIVLKFLSNDHILHSLPCFIYTARPASGYGSSDGICSKADRSTIPEQLPFFHSVGLSFFCTLLNVLQERNNGPPWPLPSPTCLSCS